MKHVSQYLIKHFSMVDWCIQADHRRSQIEYSQFDHCVQIDTHCIQADYTGVFNLNTDCSLIDHTLYSDKTDNPFRT